MINIDDLPAGIPGQVRVIKVDGSVGWETPTDRRLTKREKFAMAAMQGILSSRKLQECILHDTKHDKTTSESCFAVFAVKQADELLKQLEK